MAREKGIIKLDGTSGDISFYKAKDGKLLRDNMFHYWPVIKTEI